MKKIKILFIQNCLGHYHYPRMQNLSEFCKSKDIDFMNIEIAAYEKEYQWVITNSSFEFNNITLFPDKELSDLNKIEIWKSLKTELKKIGYCVIFIIGYSEFIKLRIKIWATLRNYPTVFVSDTNEFDRSRNIFFELIKRIFVTTCDSAFVAGTSSSNYLQKLGMSENRIVVGGYDVVDVNRIKEINKNNQKRINILRDKFHLPENYFLFVGRLIKEKNVNFLIDAYRNYYYETKNNSKWKLIICGDGPEKSNLTNYCNLLPEIIKSNIIFLGYIKQPEVFTYYSCSSCLILPSYSETWGLVVNEALACSIPVIVSDRVGSSYDLVKHNINGFIFKNNNLDDLSGLMLKISFMNQNTRNKMGKIGYEIISDWGLDRFSQSVIKSAYIALKKKRKMNENFIRNIFL